MMSTTATENDVIVAAKQSIDAGRFAEGEALLAPVLAAEPRHLVGRCVAGYSAFLRADYAAALPHLEIAVEIDPLAFDAQYLHAFTLAELHQTQPALDALARVLTLDPSCATARLRRARLLIEAGEHEAALRCLEAGRAHGFEEEDIAMALQASLDATRADDRSEVPSPAAAELPRTTAGTSLSRVEWVDPRSLLHSGRLDVCAKYLHARTLLGMPPLHSRYDTESVYLRHILFRTGGSESGDAVRKGTLAEFAAQFRQLIGSMRANGFDPAHPIPVARRTGLILNGAHRLAAALALGIEKVAVTYDESVEGLTWDFDEFVAEGFRPLELDELVRAWIDLRGGNAACILLWPPVADHWDEIERSIAAEYPRVASRDYSFASAAFTELVRDIYTSDWGPVVGDNIERKAALFANHEPKLRMLVVEVPAGRTLGTLKRTMRERYHAVVDADRFATLHTTDTPRETAHVASLLLHEESLAALRLRPDPPRPEFLAWLGDYHAALGRLAIDPEHCCVVGSSVLEALGVRDATDIDFTVTHAVREARFDGGVTHVNADLDVVARDYPRAIARAEAPGDDHLVGDRALHFRYRGLKFASLDVVVERKQTQRRAKDLADVARVAHMRLAGKL